MVFIGTIIFGIFALCSALLSPGSGGWAATTMTPLPLPPLLHTGLVQDASRGEVFSELSHYTNCLGAARLMDI